MTDGQYTQYSKRWPWLGRALGIGVALLLFYLGYCWGWWFRDNLLVQALFQCACPPVSEAARYAPFRVIASACSKPGVDISPTGNTVTIFENNPSPRSINVLSNAATIRTPLLINTSIIGVDFLTDDLLYGYDMRGQSYLIDRAVQPPRVVSIPRFDTFELTTLSTHSLGVFYGLFGTSRVVFVVRDHLEQSAYLSNPGENLNQWAKDHHTPIILLDNSRVIARHHPWQASGRGIVDSATNQILVPTYAAHAPTDWALRFTPVGWFASDRGVVYRYAKNQYLIPGGTGSPLTPPLNFFYVPQPILALDVPEELLTPTPPPSP